MIRKEKVAYIDVNYSFESNSSSDEEGNEIHIAELKSGPPYVCKALSPIVNKDISKTAT
jgi:hypothetical protein